MTNNKEQGVSLIITFFIMTIILAMVLSISLILYEQIKVIKNIGDSVVAFYAADSGIEKVLYYDRKVVPEDAVRGFCSILPYLENPGNCPAEEPETAVNCICAAPNCPPVPLDAEHNGCDPDVCNNCQISFNTNLPGDSGYGYNIDAKIEPEDDISTLKINSTGLYKDVSRKIELSLSDIGTDEDVIIIDNMSVDPISTEQGPAVNISARVRAVYCAEIVQAHIRETPLSADAPGSPVQMSIPSGDGDCFLANYEGTWNGEIGSYYIFIVARDIKGNSVVKQVWSY
jgi:hypothetical protein